VHALSIVRSFFYNADMLRLRYRRNLATAADRRVSVKSKREHKESWVV